MVNPVSRREGLVVEADIDGALIYDLGTDYAHWLDQDAAVVWEACDGRRDVEALSTHCALDEKRVLEILRQLARVGLVEQASVEDGIDRRRLLGGAAAAAFGLTAITSILAPTSAVAHSDVCLSVGQACTGSGPDAATAEVQARVFCSVAGNSELCFCNCTPILDGVGYVCSGSCLSQ